MTTPRKLRGLLALALLALLAASSARGAAHAQSDARCFPETGQCIAGPIRAYWERNGGLPIFGYPITPQRVETVEGRTLQLQWFQRDRLEIQADGLVTAGRLGARYLELTDRPWEYFRVAERGATPAGCQFFAETGHSLCEPFLSYWRANGGLERFGYPITQPFGEKIEGLPLQVQYFERRRMEIHGELPGRPVLLGLLGRAVSDRPETAATYPACLDAVPASLRQALDRLAPEVPPGCPWSPGLGLPASTQQFERGSMLWISGLRVALPSGGATTRPIFSLAEPGATLGVYSDSWAEGQDPDTPQAQPPRAGLYAPWRGFGKLWAEQPALREALGWATEPQAQPRTVDTQTFESLLLVRVNETGVVYALGDPSIAPQARVLRP